MMVFKADCVICTNWKPVQLLEKSAGIGLLGQYGSCMCCLEFRYVFVCGALHRRKCINQTLATCSGRIEYKFVRT